MGSLMRNLAACLVSVALAAPAAATAGASVWGPLKLSGGDIRAMAANPSNPNEIYAITLSAPGQVFRTKNAGAAWTRIGLLGDYLADIALDPSKPGTIYVLGNVHLHKSVNGGKAWTKHSYGQGTYAGNGKIALHPKVTQTLFAAGSVKNAATHFDQIAVLKSTDGGAHWTAKTLVPKGNWGTGSCVAVSPADPKIVYLGGYYYDASFTHFYHFFKSANGGLTWADRSGGIKTIPRAILAHPTDVARVLLATDSNVWRSGDGAKTWQMNGGTAAGAAMVSDPANPELLFAGSQKTLYRSADGGATWTAAPGVTRGRIQDLVATPGALLAGTTGGLYRSLDGGAHWQVRHKGISAAGVRTLAVAPSAPGTLYAALADDGLYKSLDTGATWSRVAGPSAWENISRIVVSPTDPNALYLLAKGAGGFLDILYRSADGGASGTAVLTRALEDVVVSQADFNRIYAAGRYPHETNKYSWYMGFFKSLDGGATWTSRKLSAMASGTAYAVGVCAANESIIYVGGDEGGFRPKMLKSANGGTTWTNATGSLPSVIRTLAVDPATPDIVYAGVDWEGVYRTKNGGLGWEKRLDLDPRVLVISPLANKTVFVGGSEDLRITTDGGDTWKAFAQGLIIPSITGLVMDAPAKILYAGTSDCGIWKRRL